MEAYDEEVFTPRFMKKKGNNTSPSPDINDVFIATLNQQQNYMKKKLENVNSPVVPAAKDSPMKSYFNFMHSTLHQLDSEERKRVFKKVRRAFEDAIDD